MAVVGVASDLSDFGVALPIRFNRTSGVSPIASKIESQIRYDRFRTGILGSVVVVLVVVEASTFIFRGAIVNRPYSLQLFALSLVILIVALLRYCLL